MAHVGSHASVPWLLEILRQAGTEYAQAKLDEIADSLVARAIHPATAQQEGGAFVRGVRAINGLVLAGGNLPQPGRPYAGAYERLEAVHQRGQARFIRMQALEGMLTTGSHSSAGAYLRDVAESSDPTAYDAVQALIKNANGGSMTGVPPTTQEQQAAVAALKALAARDRVTNIPAKELLVVWIARNA